MRETRIGQHQGASQLGYATAAACLAVVAVLNPFSLLLVGVEAKLLFAYVAGVDFGLLGLAWAGLRCGHTGGAREAAWLRVGWWLQVPWWVALEIVLLAVQLPRLSTVGGNALMQPSFELGWELPKNGEFTHPGRPDVLYATDSLGRLVLPMASSGGPTVHFFGDSVLFGYGVAPEHSALGLLSGQLSRWQVANWSVPGYGLEQMLGRLEQALSHLAVGDAVVFAPTSYDLERNLIHRASICALTYREGVLYFPRFVEGRLETVETVPRCSFVFDGLMLNSNLPLGQGVSALWHRRSRPALVANARAILARAEHLVRERGATFSLLYVPSPSECAAGEHARPLPEGSSASLLAECPEDAIDPVWHLPRDDGHWSARGNEWLAGALSRWWAEQASSRPQ